MANNEGNDAGAPETVIGATVKVEGDLVSDGDVKVEGLVTGKIKTSKNLYVGPMARIDADIEATNATIAGFIKGGVEVKEKLLVQETARIIGNISCSRLAIAEGAHFSGTCTMPEVDDEHQEPLPEEE